MTTETEARLPALREIRPGSPVAAFVPSNFEEAVRIARAISQSGMAPKSYNGDEMKILVGMMAGAEVGLTPMQALRGIAVIGNQPSLWGDVALGVIAGSGLLEDMVETQEGDFIPGGNGVAICTMKRKGRPSPVVRRYDMNRARKAGLLTKQGPWQSDPERMCQMRARAFAARDLFADILSGLGIAEVLEDELETRDIRPTTVATITDLEAQAAGGEPPKALATEGAVRATDQHERAQEAAKDASERLIEQEAARAAKSTTRRRVRKPAKESEPEESDDSPATAEGGPVAGEEPATVSQSEPEDAEFEPADDKPDAPPEAIKQRKDFIEIRALLGDDKRKAFQAGKHEVVAQCVAQMTNYTKAIKDLEARYNFPTESEPDGEGDSERPDATIYTENGGYDLNSGDAQEKPSKLAEAIERLKQMEMVVDVAGFQPEGLTDEEQMEFDSAKAKFTARLVEEAKSRRR